MPSAHASAYTAAPMDHALSHSYGAKSPLVTMGRLVFAPEITPYCGTIHKPNYLPHPWTRETYHPKWHPDRIRRFAQSTEWTDTQTNRPTDGSREWLISI